MWWVGRGVPGSLLLWNSPGTLGGLRMGLALATMSLSSRSSESRYPSH